MVLARYFKDGWESFCIAIDKWSNSLCDLPERRGCQYLRQIKIALPITYMLIDQQYADVLSLASEVVKCPFNGRRLRLGIDDEEVALRIRRIGDMLLTVLAGETTLLDRQSGLTYSDACEQKAGDRAASEGQDYPTAGPRAVGCEGERTLHHQ